MKPFLLATLVLCLTAIIACDDDPVPAYVEPDAVALDTPPLANQVEAEPEPVAEPAVQRDQEEPERETLGLIPFWTVGDLAVYQWPGGLWQPEHSYGKQALLFAEGWAQLETGEIWIRLRIQGGGHLGEWIRHDEALLPFSEVRTLEEVEAPEPLIAEVELPGGDSLVVNVLGLSEDRKWIAVRLPSDGLAAVFVGPDLFDLPALGRLPVYIGPSIGVWNPMGAEDELLASDVQRATARITWYGTAALATPIELPGAILIRGDYERHYPILGRTYDSTWIALRSTEFTYGYFWTDRSRLQLSVEVEDVPVIVSARTDVFTIGDDGTLQEPYHSAPYFRRWRWRDDDTIVGVNTAGIWRWSLATGQLTKLEESQWVRFSPDGRYAAFGIAEGNAWRTGDAPRDVVILPTDGTEAMTFRVVNQRRYTHHDGDPSLIWSPDSRYLLSRYWTEMGGSYVLGVDGSQSELLAGNSSWQRDSTLSVQADEDETMIYDPVSQKRRPAGSELSELRSSSEDVDAGLPELPAGADLDRFRSAVDVSPDGRWIVVRTLTYPMEFDATGFSVFPNVGLSWNGSWWVRVGFLLIDRESGAVLHTLLAPGNICHHGARAEFSPNGRSIAFSGLVIDCT